MYKSMGFSCLNTFACNSRNKGVWIIEHSLLCVCGMCTQQYTPCRLPGIATVEKILLCVLRCLGHFFCLLGQI